MRPSLIKRGGDLLKRWSSHNFWGFSLFVICLWSLDSQIYVCSRTWPQSFEERIKTLKAILSGFFLLLRFSFYLVDMERERGGQRVMRWGLISEKHWHFWTALMCKSISLFPVTWNQWSARSKQHQNHLTATQRYSLLSPLGSNQKPTSIPTTG